MPKRVWGKSSQQSLLAGLQIDISTMKINVENSQKARNKSNIWSTYITPRQMPEGIDIPFHRFLLNHTCFVLFRKLSHYGWSYFPKTYYLSTQNKIKTNKKNPPCNWKEKPPLKLIFRGVKKNAHIYATGVAISLVVFRKVSMCTDMLAAPHTLDTGLGVIEL